MRGVQLLSVRVLRYQGGLAFYSITLSLPHSITLRSRRAMRNLWRNAGAYIALVLVTLIFAAIQPEFRQPSNLLNILDQSVRVAVVAVGMTAMILTGGIDLSVG